jgi:predicted alpha-1,2-mannosidase
MLVVKYLKFGSALFFVLFICFVQSGKLYSQVQYVNPMIGTNERVVSGNGTYARTERGKTFPLVGVPNGMNNWTPQTLEGEKKNNPPYYYGDKGIQGFRNSHYMSGSAAKDYGTFTIMPMSGQFIIGAKERASDFSHDKETSSPMFYSVFLDRYKVLAELAGLSRSAMMKFTFQTDGDHYVVVEPNSDAGDGYIEINPEKNEISGYNPVMRIYQGWGNPAGFSGYFVVRFDKPFAAYGTWENSTIRNGQRKLKGEKTQVGAFVQFSKTPEVVQVRMASSFTSIEEARRNLEAEIPQWNFAQVKNASEAAWNGALGRIRIKGASQKDMIKFYTAMYTANQLPRVFNDVDGSYVGFAGEKQVHQAKGFDYYTDYSMWDTYRAVHPLYTILQPQRSGDMARSLILMGEQGGWLPIFPLYNSYTSAMIGDHCISMIGDAYLKGIKGFDIESAYRLMRKNAFDNNTDYPGYKDGKGRRALKSYLQYGYIPLEDTVKEAFHQREQVSRTLEYAYDDYVLSQVAKKLGKTEDYKELLRRSENYKNVYDPVSGFVRGRHSDGKWVEKFNAYIHGHSSKDTGNFFICEGTPFQYTWSVPQDVAGLVRLMGGKKPFLDKLDRFFNETHYWHGNEPCHHIAYLYPYVGEPWKTQEWVRKIVKNEYEPIPNGLCGNDDAGQMSAWLLFSMMGFYPVCPGMPYYVIGSPLFEEVSIAVENNKLFTIRTINNSDKNIYIQSASLNGKPFDRSFIWHDEIVKGGELVFVMGNKPNKSWAVGAESIPPTIH